MLLSETIFGTEIPGNDPKMATWNQHRRPPVLSQHGFLILFCESPYDIHAYRMSSWLLVYEKGFQMLISFVDEKRTLKEQSGFKKPLLLLLLA